MLQAPTLHMLCGKIASGKSWLATELGGQGNTIVISEDAWLAALYAEQLKSIPDYVRCSSNLRSIMRQHIVSVLRVDVSVVLDFQANTVNARNWMRTIVDDTGATHVLHVLDVPDEVCLDRLKSRNVRGSHPFAVTAEQFGQISKHFVPPSPDEGFDVVFHQHQVESQVRK